MINLDIKNLILLFYFGRYNSRIIDIKMTEVSGRESRQKKNAIRAEFAKKARAEFWRYPYSRTETNQKDTREEEVVCVNHKNAGDLISMVVSCIEISTTDPLSFPRKRSTWTDEQFAKIEGGVYSKLKRKMKDADTSTKTKIIKWIKGDELVDLFEDYYDRYNEENIDDLSYRNPLCERLQIYQYCNPIAFKWMWVIYTDYRKEIHPKRHVCECGCQDLTRNADDDRSKITFEKFFEQKDYRFYTPYTKKLDYFHTIGGFMRMIYRAIVADVPVLSAPSAELVPVLSAPLAPSAPVVETAQPTAEPLVSDEELMAKIAELKVKYPDQTSVKSLCKHLKREKTEWQVTETRITKLLKKPLVSTSA